MDKSTEQIRRVKNQFGIIGNSPRLYAALQIALQVAPTSMSVLINGPSGSGKEAFSRIIHAYSKRKHEAFIAVNCGAIPEGTIDSELFGHEKGAFTGAHEARKGYFETADKGTIFLDEVGEMPLSTQARLLRVLETGEYIRVGASRIKKTDVRIVAATNRDLQVAASQKKFREDLYYRLGAVPIHIPSLIERKEDLVLLFESFVMDACERHHRPNMLSLSKAAAQRLVNTYFPGNIRQLKNLAERVSLLEKGPVIEEEALAAYLPNPKDSLPIPHPLAQADKEPSLHERELLYELLLGMRKDMQELKKITYHLLQDREDKHNVLHGREALFDDVVLKKSPETETNKPAYIVKRPAADLVLDRPASTDKQNKELLSNSPPTASMLHIDDRKVEDIPHAPSDDPETLSLHAHEKEMITRALFKYGKRRKSAAEELGISERTLYRKIKYYDISI